MLTVLFTFLKRTIESFVREGNEDVRDDLSLGATLIACGLQSRWRCFSSCRVRFESARYLPLRAHAESAGFRCWTAPGMFPGFHPVAAFCAGLRSQAMSHQCIAMESRWPHDHLRVPVVLVLCPETFATV